MSASYFDSGTRPAIFPVAGVLAALTVTGSYQAWSALGLWGFGDPGWEVSAIGQLSAGFGLLLLGLVGFTLMVMAGGLRRFAMVLGSLLVFVGVGVGVLGLIAALDAPVVWNAAKSIPPEVARGYKLVTVKAVGLSGLYGFGCLVVGAQVLRSAISSRR